MKVDASMSLNELLGMAIKSEIESHDIYMQLAEKVENFILKEKLKFLALEEAKHRELLETIFKLRFPDTELRLPSATMVPVPKFTPKEGAPLSTVLSKAMEAEEEAQKFYSDLIPMFREDKIKQTLKYLSQAEQSHYYQLKGEYEMALNFETYDEYHPMMHIGA
jgi:rubrerythrin